jgi:hypothetical protein
MDGRADPRLVSNPADGCYALMAIAPTPAPARLFHPLVVHHGPDNGMRVSQHAHDCDPGGSIPACVAVRGKLNELWPRA